MRADGHTREMAAKVRGVDRGARLGRRAVVGVGEDIRLARVGAGLSQADVGRAAGVSHTSIGRVERGQIAGVAVLQLARICGVVGLDLSVRTYPGPAPLRDAAHVALLERLRVRLHPALRLATEVPMPIDGDQRAWDAMVIGLADRTGVEAETRLTDVQALLRRIAIKQRDSDVSRALLILSDTANNRTAVRAASTILTEAFPVKGRSAMSALASASHPSGSAIVFL